MKFLLFMCLSLALCAPAEQWIIDGWMQREAPDPQTAVNTAAITEEVAARAVGDEAINAALDSGVRRLYNGISAPASPSVGDVWYDTVDNKLKIYDGSWRYIPELLKFADANGIVKNADRLDGCDSTYFLPRTSSCSVTAGYATFSGAWLNGFLDVVNKAYLKNGLDVSGDIYATKWNATFWMSAGTVFADDYNKAGNTNNDTLGSFSSHSIIQSNRIGLLACQDSTIRNCQNIVASGYGQQMDNADGCFIGGAENSVTNASDCLIHTKLSSITDCGRSVFLGGTGIVAGNVTNSVVMGRDFTITNLDGVFYVKGLSVMLNLPDGTTAPAEIPAGALWVDSDDDYTVKVKQ